jgi:hypothetical protein
MFKSILHLSYGRVDIVLGDCSTMEHVTHCEAIVFNGTGLTSAYTKNKIKID